MVRKNHGYSLLELVVAMSVFGIFLIILATLTLEMRGQEKRHPVAFMSHPQVGAVVFRLRRDVLDAAGTNPYPMDTSDIPGAPLYTQSNKVLIINTMVGGGQQRVVWDFTVPREVRRISYNVALPTEWIARGLPQGFKASIDAIEMPGHAYGVRITAVDAKGMLALDQYLQPRAHN